MYTYKGASTASPPVVIITRRAQIWIAQPLPRRRPQVEWTRKKKKNSNERTCGLNQLLWLSLILRFGQQSKSSSRLINATVTVQFGHRHNRRKWLFKKGEGKYRNGPVSRCLFFSYFFKYVNTIQDSGLWGAKEKVVTNQSLSWCLRHCRNWLAYLFHKISKQDENVEIFWRSK